MNLHVEDFPFRHWVIDGYLDSDTVAAINREWPSGGWDQEEGAYQVKWNQQKLPNSARKVVDGLDLEWLRELTGISDLFPDPDLCGAGLHCIPPFGFLKMHCDFDRHPEHGDWKRRLNFLIYLNEQWKDSWGGHLSLGEEQETKIAPLGGRAVIFETTDTSWHGHPEPLFCPPDVQRRSLAMYFYTKLDRPQGTRQTTKYKVNIKGKKNRKELK